MLFHRLIFAAALVLSPPAVFAQSGQEIAFIKQVFAQLQPRSFANNSEYCGYIGYDANGRLRASPAVRGASDYCDARWPNDLEVIASYHTHGGFDPDTWGEIPSGTDMEADEAEGIDGWVATPGGRLWYIDTEDMVTSQICGVGCLGQAPGFYRGVDGQIAQSYSYNQLIRKLNSN